MTKKKAIEEQSQWVMVAPKTLTETKDEKESEDEEGTFCKMAHPQNGVSNLFLVQRKQIFQLTRCEDHKYRSWFIDNTVQKDGSLHFLTPVDPLFLVLPYVERSGVSGKFVPLDNILVDDRHPLAMQLLERCVDNRSLSNICECKGSDDFFAYKVNEEKILKWLSLKTHKLSAHLKQSTVHVGGNGARVKTFICVEKKTEEDCLRYAWTLVSDYLSASWSQKLKEHLKITDEMVAKPANDNDDVKPVAKKQKLNDSTSNDKPTGVVEDYRNHAVKQPVKKKALTTAQKKVEKIDKKGMKTMSSFFTSKPKKK